jgi:nucleoside-diphosphate-sugar epimerase
VVKPLGTVAITGASGYIGRHLVAQLSQLGEGPIKVLSRQQHRVSYPPEFDAGVNVIEGDLRVPGSFRGFLEPGCTVVHLAYLQSAGESENLAATANLLAACKAANIKRFVHCSTAAVVGRVLDSTINENTPCRPVSGYGITKLKIERAVAQAVEDFDVVILRPTSVFGPDGGSLKKLVSDLTARKRLRNYLKSCLFNKRSMNLVHVTNVVAAIIFAARREDSFNGEIFIVSDDDDSKNVFSDVEQILMEHLEIENYRLPKLDISLAVIEVLLKILGRDNINPRCKYEVGKLLGLGFVRPIKFDDGLKDYADWYRSTTRLEVKPN